MLDATKRLFGLFNVFEAWMWSAHYLAALNPFLSSTNDMLT